LVKADEKITTQAEIKSFDFKIPQKQKVFFNRELERKTAPDYFSK